MPAIMRWPEQLPNGAVSPAISSTLDLLPTFAAAAGASVPSSHKLHGGVDLVKAVAEHNKLDSRPLFFEFRLPQRGVIPASLPIAVRKGQWKLFAAQDLKTVQLYNLDNDPGEESDVASSNPAVARQLKRELKRWKAQFRNAPRTPGRRVETPSEEELEKKYYRN